MLRILQIPQHHNTKIVSLKGYLKSKLEVHISNWYFCNLVNIEGCLYIMHLLQSFLFHFCENLPLPTLLSPLTVTLFRLFLFLFFLLFLFFTVTSLIVIETEIEISLYGSYSSNVLPLLSLHAFHVKHQV